MKKTTFIAILLCIGSNNLMAEFQFQDQSACNKSEIQWLLNTKKYMDLDVSNLYLAMTKAFVDVKTLKIDRINKTIDADIFYLRHKKMRAYSEADYGLDHEHFWFNYEKRTTKTQIYDRSACNGDIIQRIDLSHLEENALGDRESSIAATCLDGIIKKYNLK